LLPRVSGVKLRFVRRRTIAAIIVVLLVAGCGGGRFTPALRVTDVKREVTGRAPVWQPKRFLPEGLVFVSAKHGWLSLSRSAESLYRRGVLETHDGGRSWMSTRAMPQFQPLPFHDTSRVCLHRPPHFAIASSFWTGSNGYAVCGGEQGTGNQPKWLYETTDGGKTWRERASEKNLPAYGYVEALRFFDSQNGAMLTVRGGIYTTGDGGITWRRSFHNPGEGTIYWSWPDRGDGFIAAWDSGVYVTHDLGRHWQRIWPKTTPVSYASAKIAIAVEALFGADPQSGSSIIRTTSGGGGWGFWGRIWAGATVSQLVRISPKNVVAVASSSWTGYGRLGLFRSGDNGRSWRRLTAPKMGNTDASSVSISFAGGEGLLLVPDRGRLFATHNGGSSWQLVSSHPRFSTVVVLDSKHFLATLQNATDAYSSDDGGRSWQRLRPGVSGSGMAPLTIAASDRQHMWIAAAGEYLLRSVNGGKSWIAYRFENSFDVSRLIFVSPTVGFATLDDPSRSPVRPTLITRNGGRTWTSLSPYIVVCG
jgi:photosystem II stability/assembly factor-like uncharacterized protein